MDTSTHFVMGVGLFGLAHIDPIVATHPATATAVLAATVIGSQLPDTDGLYRFKGPAAYVRNHRGWTHSLPMILIWPILLTCVLILFFPESYSTHVFFWAFSAVFIHVFIDLLNTYGTQAFRPFTSKWISWNILSIFDPFLFSIHLLGFLLWAITSYTPTVIFGSIYLILIAYVLWRTWVHHKMKRWIKNQTVPATHRITLTPTVRWHVWNVIMEEEKGVKIGEIRNKQLIWTGYISKGALSHPVVQKTKEAEAVDAFLSFTSYGYPVIYERSFGYEVRWLDVRYHYKKHFPFVAVAFLDKEHHIHDAFVGFMGEQLLKKRARDFEKTFQQEVENQ